MMKTNDKEPRTARRVPLAMIAILAGTLVFAGCEDVRVEPRRVTGSVGELLRTQGNARGDPGCAQESIQAVQDQDVLRRDLERAQRVASLNRAALDQLRKDRTTAEPARYEGFDSAVADTMAMIEQADAEADCLETVLDAQDR